MAFAIEAQETAITTATTTDILDARAGATDEARVKAGMITIRNKGAADNLITLIKDVSATDYEITEFTLKAEEEWVNPMEIVCNGTTDKIQLTTSSTSAIDVVVSYVEKT